MPTTFNHTELFGGAITADIPSGFADVSTIRQVPDNQEVYLEANGFTSLTVDLTERVTQFSTDREALEYHFNDILAEEDSKTVVSISENVQLLKSLPGTPTLSLIATARPPPSLPGINRPYTPTHIDIHLTLIRLVERNTDILVVLNVPHMPGNTEAAIDHDINQGDDEEEVKRKLALQTERAMDLVQVLERVVMSLEIKDWSLFR